MISAQLQPSEIQKVIKIGRKAPLDGLYIDHFSRDITASITGNTLYNNGHTFNYGGRCG
jgi:hypothetical protein